MPSSLRPIGAATGLRRHMGDGRRRWVWLLPMAVAFAVLGTPASLVQLWTGAIIGVGMIVIVAHHPGPALVTLVAGLPFQTFVLAGVLRLGVPAQLVRLLGFWKEAVVAGLVLAAARRLLAQRARLDHLDLAAAIYLAVVTAYLVLPEVAGPAGPSAPAAPPGLNLRFLSYRADVVFVVVFLAARHAPIGRVWLSRLARAVFATGVTVAAIAVAELVFSDAWNTLAVRALRIPTYRASVLRAVTLDPSDIRIYGEIAGRDIIRVGSVLLDHLWLGYYLVLPLAIGVERMARRRASRCERAGTAVVGLALVLTQTRGAILVALLAALVALRPLPGRSRRGRRALALSLAGAAVALVPVAMTSGLADRVAAVTDRQDASTVDHVEALEGGLRQVVDEPLGRGLGTAPSFGRRVDATGAVSDGMVTENYYLQLANEVGVPSLLVFAVFLAMVVRRLGRLAAAGTGGEVTAALWGAALAMVVAGLLHQLWNDLTVAWTVWGAFGLALGVAERAGHSHPPHPAGVGTGEGLAVSARGAEL